MFDINYLAVLVAAVASMIIGFVWYGVLFKNAWIKAMKLKEGELDMERPWVPYLISFITSTLLAAAFSMIFNVFPVTSLAGAALVALIMWVGFVALVMGRNYAYANKSTKLYAIDAGYVLVEMIAIALIIAAWV